MYIQEGQNIIPFQYKALQYNITTHYDLNNKYKVELVE